MSAFENARKFFVACEAPEGWEGCKPYVAEDASFTAQSEPLTGINTVEAYCDWMAALERLPPREPLMICTPLPLTRRRKLPSSLEPITHVIPERAGRCLPPTKKQIRITSTF